MRVVVVGGSAGGQFASLLLSRAGHEVVLLDRDALGPVADVDEAAGCAFRPAVPQFVHPHVVLSRCRWLLRRLLPDVHGALLAAGAIEVPLSVSMPASLPDRSERPGDDDYTVVATRRSTFDWVLRRAVAQQRGVEVRDRLRVTGLLTRAGIVPRVVGVSTVEGDVAADLVVDASGRRTRLDSWLTAAGAKPTSVVHAECGLAYYSRHYRLRSGIALPGHPCTRIVLALDEFTTGVWGSDNNTMLVAVAPLVEDKRFRGLADPTVFTSVVRTVPALAPWLEVMDPISDIYAMGGLNNTMRRLVVDGTPVATGLAAVGDVTCTTNPTFGRGLALALQNAADLLEALGHPADHADDPSDLMHTLDAAVTEHVEPFYRDQARNDEERLTALRQRLLGTPAPIPAPADDRVTFAGLRAAMPWDADVFRGFWKVMGMLAPPDQVYADQNLVARTRDVLSSLGAVPAVPQPTRDQLEAALTVPASILR